MSTFLININLILTAIILFLVLICGLTAAARFVLKQLRAWKTYKKELDDVLTD